MAEKQNYTVITNGLTVISNVSGSMSFLFNPSIPTNLCLNYGAEQMLKGIIFEYEKMADRLDKYLARDSPDRNIITVINFATDYS